MGIRTHASTTTGRQRSATAAELPDARHAGTAEPPAMSSCSCGLCSGDVIDHVIDGDGPGGRAGRSLLADLDAADAADAAADIEVTQIGGAP